VVLCAVCIGGDESMTHPRTDTWYHAAGYIITACLFMAALPDVLMLLTNAESSIAVGIYAGFIGSIPAFLYLGYRTIRELTDW
jgi:hypothetical protein